MFDWKSILINPKDSIDKAIHILNKGVGGILLVAKNDNVLLGTITDGDIRRALIKKLSMDTRVADVMNSNPIKAKSPYTREEILNEMSSKGLLHMPIIDDNEVLCGLETLKQLIEKPTYDNPVFLMAGGFGKRLLPLTEEIPKPLLNVGNKPLLEIILKQFIDSGFHNFYISIHYKSEMIKKHFGDGSSLGVSIQYVEEKKPLGTAGSLALLPETLPNIPIIMMNGDLLTSVDYKSLIDFHLEQGGDATMCVREYNYTVPYGVVSIKNNLVTGIEEKPVQKFFVNAGIYILSSKIVNNIKKKVNYLDMTSLLEKIIHDSGNVNLFPVHEYWLDIGQIDQYEKAKKDSQEFFSD
jgi:dTDP-glucose pyrophosphorylase/predicted transcriptional regulator